MKKLLAGALLFLGVSQAYALNAPDTVFVTGPNNQQTSASNILVTPSGGTQTTLGAALATSSTGSFTTPVNTTSNYKINNLNALTITTPSAEPSMLGGPFSGVLLPLSQQFVIAYGPYTYESLTATAPESIAMGSGASISQTTAGASVALGTSACASQTTQGCIAIGSDAQRDLWLSGGNATTAIGNGSQGDGAPSGPNLTIGNSTLQGNAGTITIGGTITTGDVMTFTPSTTNACNGTSITVNCTSGSLAPVSYTVTSGDTTLAILAGHVAAALNNLPLSEINYVLGDGVSEGTHNLFAVDWLVADPTNHPTLIKGHFPSSWKLSWAYSCTGTCGETATIAGPFSGSGNLAIGDGVLSFFGATTASGNTIVGENSVTSNCTSCSSNTITGSGLGNAMTTGQYNIVMSYNGFTGCTTCGQNSVFGPWAGTGITTGTGNGIFGNQTGAGGSCITTGSNNYEIGQGACVPSATTNNQLAIMNVIYGTGNSASGSSVSTGSIGIGQTAPGARFDILGTGTSTELAFRVQNSTPTVLFSIADNNTITVAGTTAVSCAANTVSLTTLVVTDGIVTHC